MSALIDVTLSAEDREGTSTVLQKWFKRAGDPVRQHEPLAELETDKVVVELAAPADGLLVEILKSEGEAFEPGEVLARIDGSVAPADAMAPVAMTAATAGDKTPAAAAGSSTPRGRTSPAVRRLLREHGLDAADISGSGQGGRVTAADVEHMAGLSKSHAPDAAGRSRVVPHDAMRRRIASHMVESLLRTAPHVTSVFEADMSSVLAHRARHRAAFENDGVKLTVTAYFVAACARALAAVPEVNSRFHAEHLEIFSDINIGVGTALADKGLIVPVLRRVQDMDLKTIAAKLGLVTEAARSGRLGPDDVRGGTFTISNHGVSGSLIASPIVINQPQSAILGVGKLKKRVCVIEQDGHDSIQIRPLCYVTLTIDHRALDAHQTNRFLGVVVETLEAWTG